MSEKIKSIVEKRKLRLPKISFSVKTKALLPTVIIILFFGFLATYFVYRQAVDNLITLEKDTVAIITQKQARETAKYFKMGEYVVEAIANHPDVIDYVQDKTTQDEKTLKLLQNYNLGDSFLAIYIMDVSGNTLVSTDPSFVGKNYGYRKYFQEAIKVGRGIDVAVGSTSGELGYYFSSAVYVDSKASSVVVAKMHPDRINHTFTNQSVENSNISSFLVDELGVVVYGNEEDKVYKSLGRLNLNQKQDLDNWQRYPNEIESLDYDILQSKLNSIDNIESFDIYNGVDGEHELLFIKKLEEAPFFVLTKVGLENIQDAAVKSALSIGFIVIVAAVTALILISTIISKVLKPIEELTQDAIDISGGNYDKHLSKVKTNDEFERLREAFEKMRKKFVGIRDSLTEKVQVQTSELEKKQSALLNVLEDIEEEKKIVQAAVADLQKFKMATDSVAEQIVITDLDGKIIYVNPATKKITGYSRDEVIGKKAGSSELWGGNMSKEFYKDMWDTIKNKKKVFKGEVENTRKNGDNYIASATIAPVLDKEGRVVFFVGTEKDITKRKEIDRMKSEFISLVSHQLRTPLSAMKWFLEMVLDGDVGKLNKEQEEYITNVNDSNKRMIDLVNSLLNVSRIDSGRIIVDPQPTKLSSLVSGLLEELKPKIENKNIDFIFSASDKIPEINIDPKLIRNVYQNLLTNSIKYTPEGGEIIVMISKEDDKIISQVSDNGYGIPEDSKEQIFDKFYRGSNAISKEPEGNGLGLYLAKTIVETSGGEIWFESKENEGTTFWFSLPMKGSKPRDGAVSIDS